MPRDPSKGGPNDRERLQHMLDVAADVRSHTDSKCNPPSTAMCGTQNEICVQSEALVVRSRAWSAATRPEQVALGAAELGSTAL
ncbi:MAG: hypothetical protein K2W85_08795 [Phycisphaerales bacterium]|nr:hypothetical protein [Phycisphaerales bacterium]